MAEYYGEINLVEYLKLLKRRKKLILAIFLFFIIASAVYTFLIASKIYEAQAVVQLGTTEIKRVKRGAVTVFENPLQVAQKIKSGVYGDYSGLKVNNLEGTSLIAIKIDNKDPQEAENLLKNLIDRLLSDHNDKINQEKEPFLEKQADYNRTIENINKDISSLLVRGQQIGDLKLKIYEYELLNKDLEIQLAGFKNTSIVKGPEVSDKPISPNPFFDITISGVLGIVCGIFLAFFAEWWKKNKQEIKP